MRLTKDDRLFSINNNVFQILLVDEKPFGESNNVFTLAKYAKSELKYLEDKIYNVSLKSKSEILDKKETRLNVTAIFWFYETPSQHKDQVLNHLYVSFSHNSKIIGIYMPQFNGQEFNKIKQLLLEVFNSLNFSEQRITFETLCKEINK